MPVLSRGAALRRLLGPHLPARHSYDSTATWVERLACCSLEVLRRVALPCRLHVAPHSEAKPRGWAGNWPIGPIVQSECSVDKDKQQCNIV